MLVLIYCAKLDYGQHTAGFCACGITVTYGRFQITVVWPGLDVGPPLAPVSQTWFSRLTQTPCPGGSLNEIPETTMLGLKNIIADQSKLSQTDWTNERMGCYDSNATLTLAIEYHLPYLLARCFERPSAVNPTKVRHARISRFSAHFADTKTLQSQSTSQMIAHPRGMGAPHGANLALTMHVVALCSTRCGTQWDFCVWSEELDLAAHARIKNKSFEYSCTTQPFNQFPLLAE